MREIAEAGRLVIWYSTEDLEFLECDRVFVFSKNRIIRELHGTDIDEDTIVASSFAGARKDERRTGTGRENAPRRLAPRS
ncbi:hypothetical protein F2981_24255 (plasmid) [Sinorhizobium meliloti]|nr:hypothetical protein [Sinorhizobium meliloti]